MQMNRGGDGGSSFDTNWNVEEYRHEWDSDEQWEVRREFILTHKNTIPEDRLVCLAQVYANIEFLGCSYNDDLMKQVESLAEGLSTDHRDRKRRAEGIQFVKETKPSGDKRSNADPSPQQSKYQRVSDNRSSASSYFGSNSSGSFVPAQNANSYQTQSYYTRDYKSNQVQGGGDRNWGSGAADESGTTSSLPHAASQQKNWTSGNEQLLVMTQKFQRIGAAIESDTFEASDCYRRLVKFSFKEGLVVKKKIMLQKKQHWLQIFIGDVLAIATEAKSKKGIVIDAVFKLYEIFKTKSWKLVLKDSMAIELSVTGEKESEPTSPEPDVDDCIPMQFEKGIDKIEITPELNNALHGFFIVDRLKTTNKSAILILHHSASFFKKKLTYEWIMDPEKLFNRCVVLLEGVAVGEGRDTIAQMAKLAAAEAALSRLRSLVCTLQIKEGMVSECLSRESVMNTSGVGCNEKAIDKDNLGNKLLRMMGWTGGGLGKGDNKGIAEPLTVQAVCGRRGLGLSEDRGVTKDFIRKSTDVIRNYAASNLKDTLRFSFEFSKEERAEIHKIAAKFSLKSYNAGKKDNRFLMIRRQTSYKIKGHELMRLVMEAGGTMHNYQVFPPCKGDANSTVH